MIFYEFGVSFVLIILCSNVVALLFVGTNKAVNIRDKETRRKERLFQLNIMDYFWDVTNSLGDLSSLSSGGGKTDIFTNRRRCRCKCGTANTRNGRLLGGTDLAPFEFPWLVNIQVKGISPVPGTLINDRYVLTAASTMKKKTPFDIKVAIGQHDICHSDVTSTIHSVHSILLHPEFTSKTRQNDIALIRLSENVRFGELVSPICLPSAGSSDKYKHLVTTIATWIKEGSKFRSRAASSFNLTRTTCLPRKIGLPVLDVSTCSEAASKTQGCLGVIGAPSVLCADDAGAGVMYRTSTKSSYVLIGVLSDLQQCGYPIDVQGLENIHDYSLPMFTKVINHLPWIRQNTKDGCICTS